jgi:hypothetical protein
MRAIPRPARAAALLAMAPLLLLPSCAFAIGAAIGAGTVYALGEDAARVYLEAPMADVLEASRAVVVERGEIERDDPGESEAILVVRGDEYQYTVELKALTPNTTELVVSARRWARMAPAQEEATRMADRIALRVGG